MLIAPWGVPAREEASGPPARKCLFILTSVRPSARPSFRSSVRPVNQPVRNVLDTLYGHTEKYTI